MGLDIIMLTVSPKPTLIDVETVINQLSNQLGTNINPQVPYTNKNGTHDWSLKYDVSFTEDTHLLHFHAGYWGEKTYKQFYSLCFHFCRSFKDDGIFC